MGKTITLPDDVYARLKQQAAAQGITIPDLISKLERDLEEARLDAAEESMRADGLLLPRREPAPGDVLDFEPIPVKGKPVSETIIEERR
ncbi:MAG: hypothetical protein AB7R89_32145 [Dehalococcoidia bacterium]